MRILNKKRLYMLADSETLSNYYYVENDIVKKQPFKAFDHTTNSPFLPNNPIGWKDEEISWMSGDDYMLNRSFNLALEFVYDGARIIRDRLYKGAGYEETIYLVILKWNREDDTYYIEYKGKLDLSTAEDTIAGSIKVNSIEGGILSYFTANKDTTYEIACDDSNEFIKMVLLDGMTLSDTLSYNGILTEQESYIGNLGVPDVWHTYWTIAFVYTENEGDNIGIITGNPVAEKIGNNQSDIDAYAASSSNYVLETENPIAGLGIKGKYDYKTISLATEAVDAGSPPPNTVPISQAGLEPNLYYFTTSDTTLKPLYTGNGNYAPIGTLGSISFEDTLGLIAGDKLFIVVDIRIYNPHDPYTPITTNTVEQESTTLLKTTLNTSKLPTTTYCLSFYDYYKLIVQKLTDGKYTGESNYLKSRTDLVATCGDALRNTDRNVIKNYTIASSFDDFFKSIPGDKTKGSSVGLQIRGNVLYLELLSDLYNENAQIFDLGEVSDFKIKVAQNEICNTIQNGYPDQNYDTNGGKLEVNSSQEWQLPVISNKKVFDIRSIWRADPRGIEKIRNKYTHLDTTDNEGDKQPFILQVSNESLQQKFSAFRNTDKEYTGGSFIEFETVNNENDSPIELADNNYNLNFTGSFNKAFIVGSVDINNSDGRTFQFLIRKNGFSVAVFISNGNSFSAAVNSLDLTNGDVLAIEIIPFGSDSDTVDFTVTHAMISITFLMETLKLYRLDYDDIAGVVDNTVYNVELRPRNQILWHGNELRGKLAQLTNETITLNTAAKNTNLATTINGVTVSENDPINISSLAAPLYLPYDGVFTTQVPYTFTDLLAMSTSGYFTWTANGYRFYGLPWGSMKCKPATSEAQEWQLRISPRNLLANMFGASYSELITLSTNNNNMIAASIYSPLHWIKYNFSLQSKYHHADMYEDWSYKRFQNWVKVPFYAQKWQLTDTIKTPVLTTGLGALTMFVYDKDGKEYTTYPFSVVPSQYVKLPFILQECDIPLSTFDEGLYLFVIKAAGEPVWISEWCDIRTNWRHTFLIKYSNSENEKNLPWKAYNGYMELRVEAEFGQWEPDSEATDYEDDYADFTILSNTPMQKRQLLIGHVTKVPEWMGLKMNAILLKDRVFIEGEINDETKHYTRRASSQMELVRYSGMPYMSYSIEVIPATNQSMLVSENLPVNEINGWHATIDAQVFGDDIGSTEITILNE